MRGKYWFESRAEQSTNHISCAEVPKTKLQITKIALKPMKYCLKKPIFVIGNNVKIARNFAILHYHKLRVITRNLRVALPGFEP